MEKTTSQMAEAQFPFRSLFLFLSLLPSLASLSFFRKKGFFLLFHMCCDCMYVSVPCACLWGWKKRCRQLWTIKWVLGPNLDLPQELKSCKCFQLMSHLPVPFFPLVRENSLQSPSLLSSNRDGFLTLNTFERLMLSKLAIFPIVTERGFFLLSFAKQFPFLLEIRKIREIKLDSYRGRIYR